MDILQVVKMVLVFLVIVAISLFWGWLRSSVFPRFFLWIVKKVKKPKKGLVDSAVGAIDPSQLHLPSAILRMQNTTQAAAVALLQSYIEEGELDMPPHKITISADGADVLFSFQKVIHFHELCGFVNISYFPFESHAAVQAQAWCVLPTGMGKHAGKTAMLGAIDSDRYGTGPLIYVVTQAYNDVHEYSFAAFQPTMNSINHPGLTYLTPPQL